MLILFLWWVILAAQVQTSNPHIHARWGADETLRRNHRVHSSPLQSDGWEGSFTEAWGDSVSPRVKTSRMSDSSQRAKGRRVHEWLPGNRIRQFSALVSSQCFAFSAHIENVTRHLPSECAWMCARQGCIHHNRSRGKFPPLFIN